MSNETKRDVFDDALAYAPVGREYDPVNDDEAGDLRSCLSARYAAALPDDLPVVSKEVSNIMITYRFLWWKEFLDKAYDNELDKELSDDDDINYRVRSESADVARALILGAWRIKENGEIVKLEEEK